MPACTGQQVLLMIQCVFNMLVCTRTGHPIFFFETKLVSRLGALINTLRFEIPDLGASPICRDPATLGDCRETVSNFKVGLHIGDFPVVKIVSLCVICTEKGSLQATPKTEKKILAEITKADHQLSETFCFIKIYYVLTES